MNVFSRFNRPRAVSSPVGNAISHDFSETIVDGLPEVIKSGETSLNDFVQASLEETKVYNVLNRYMQGDISALDKVQGVFIDTCNLPKNLAEAQQHLINVTNQFNQLPADVKAKFDNSVDVFISRVSNMDIDSFQKEFFGSTNVVEPIIEEPIIEEPIIKKEGVVNE